VIRDRGGGPPRGLRLSIAGAGRERGGVRVETQADLASARLDQAREPVGEGGAQPPLTFCFRPAPAENFGTLPPGIVIRSPVRGLTPWR
jgi:hypothetical protein